jgi:hypothetical protein
MRLSVRSSVYAAALLLAGTGTLAAPAAAQASIPGRTVVPCSSSALVTAIQQANSARFTTIVLSRSCNYVLTSAASPGDGLPPITGDIVILGSGGTTISRSSSTAFRIIEVAASGRLSLVNVTVANGSTPDKGGGIRNNGTLALRGVRLTGNSAGNGGGGLAVEIGARATVSFSQLAGNDAGSGGGILSFGQLAVNHSRVDGNSAASDGGGVNTQGPGTSRITGTVVTRNRAGSLGGGLSNLGTTVLIGDRVVFNRAFQGGGISRNQGTVSLRFTLVAFNSPDNCTPRGAIRGCRH